MIFSYNWLKEYLKNSPKPKELANLLTLHCFEAEVEKQKNDWILNIDILPNRYDGASYFGLAKEIQLINQKSKVRNQKLNKILITQKPKVKTRKLQIKVENPDLCPRYIGVLIEGIENKKSPKFIKERLSLYGINSYNLIVDLTNYVMLETGQPLHSFDASKIKDKNSKIEIFIRKAKKNEEIFTLDENKYQLDKDILVIASRSKPLAIAGIKGGKFAEVDFDSKTILFEGANFDREVIYLASKKLKLETDASIRFSHQLSKELPQMAMSRLIELVLKFFPKAKIVEFSDFYQKPSRKIILFDFEKYKNYLGEEVSRKETKEIFKRMGANLVKETKQGIFIEPPKERIDLNLDIDLFEEVARVIGYQKLKSNPPLSLIFPKRPKDEVVFEEKTRDIFTSMGFDEVYNYSMKRGEKWEMSNGNWKEIKILNPTSKEFEYLRSNLIYGFLKNVSLNFKFFKDLKIFEIGKIFYQKGNKFFEEKHFGAVVARKNQKDPNEVFYETKGYLESFFEKNGIDRDDYELRNPKSKILNSKQIQNSEFKIRDLFHSYKLAEIFDYNKKYLGFIGEIKEEILKKFDISLKEKPKVCVFELNFKRVLNLVLGEREFMPLPKYPAVIRDISILVDLDTKVDEVMKVIYDVSPKYVEDVDLFDIYVGENLEERKKSLAFHIIFQAKDHTLTDKEVEDELKKIFKSLKTKLNAQIRS